MRKREMVLDAVETGRALSLQNKRKKEKGEKPESTTVETGRVSPEQTAIWKGQHRDVFEVRAGDKVCYLKRPDRLTLQAADAVGNSDIMKYNEVLLENCWLGGDAEIKSDDSYFMQVLPVLSELVDFGRASIKKL